MKLITAKAALRLLLLLVIVTAGVEFMIGMPGRSFKGPLPPATTNEMQLAGRLRRHVEHLAGGIGCRNVVTHKKLAQAADYIAAQCIAAGFACHTQTFEVHGVPCRNLEVEIPGGTQPDEVVVIGAHYDTCGDAPGANDNGSGVAALLELARDFSGVKPACTLRFVAFVNEEPPFFQTENMGSLVYARACRMHGDHLVAMLALETIGYFSDVEHSQRYPPPFNLLYPNRGNFIGFIGNLSSRALVRKCVRSFRAHAQFPSEGGALPGFIMGVGWSDHWSFWQVGCPAVMVTDTAPFRYPHYHLLSDTPDKLNYERLARVTIGLKTVIGELAQP